MVGLVGRCNLGHSPKSETAEKLDTTVVLSFGRENEKAVERFNVFLLLITKYLNNSLCHLENGLKSSPLLLLKRFAHLTIIFPGYIMLQQMHL